MRRFIKWFGIVLASLAGLLLIAGVAFYISGTARLNKIYDIPPSNISLPTDAASLEIGKHRVESLCAGCHGEDLSGITNWFDSPLLGTIDSANLTAGEGGVGRQYTAEDYVRAIRHGVNAEGSPIFMPAVVSTAHLSDQELASIIAYIKSLPDVDHQTNGQNFSPVAKVIFGAGMLGKLPAETVSHEVSVTAPPAGPTAEYGEYLVNTHDCHLCHGENLNGAPYPDPTITKISPNLTPGGELAYWTEEQFMNAIRTGMTPGGHQLDPKFMPWDYYRNFYDDELKAIWLYLQSLEKLPQYTG